MSTTTTHTVEEVRGVLRQVQMATRELHFQRAHFHQLAQRHKELDSVLRHYYNLDEAHESLTQGQHVIDCWMNNTGHLTTCDCTAQSSAELWELRDDDKKKKEE